MRKVMVAVWMILIFIGTCSRSTKDLFFFGKIRFELNPHPSWSGLFHVFHEPDRVFIMQKIGHFIVFFIFALLVCHVARIRTGLATAIFYALFTELIQPLFYRDARVLDMFIDSLGILLAYFILKKINQVRKSNPRGNYYSGERI